VPCIVYCSFLKITKEVPHEKNIIVWCSVISKRLRNTVLVYECMTYQELNNYVMIWLWGDLNIIIVCPSAVAYCLYVLYFDTLHGKTVCPYIVHICIRYVDIHIIKIFRRIDFILILYLNKLLLAQCSTKI